MHPNPAFHTASEQKNLEFARDRGFGVLAISTGGAPLLSHIPFLLEEDGKAAVLHLVRSNPIARNCEEALPARIAVSGPDSYISPDWYEASDQVPTWNYVAVHLTGQLQRLSQDRLREIIDRQSAHFEDRLAPKPPWRTDKMTPDVLQRLMRQIVPFMFHIEQVDGTWKLNQNKDDQARRNAAQEVENLGTGHEVAVLSAMMQMV